MYNSDDLICPGSTPVESPYTKYDELEFDELAKLAKGQRVKQPAKTYKKELVKTWLATICLAIAILTALGLPGFILKILFFWLP